MDFILKLSYSLSVTLNMKSQTSVLTLAFVMFLATLLQQTLAITRPETMKRAQFWFDKEISHTVNTLNYAQDPSGKQYRVDSFGFVCMSWKAYQSLNYARIDSVAHTIGKSELKQGDAMCNCGPGKQQTGYILIFDKWANTDQTSYWAYELPAGGKVTRREVPYPYFQTNATFKMIPYRYDSMQE